jgi:DNA invertase Pin-like site-specific DNA recombinase
VISTSKFVSYRRVSGQKQGASGLGLEGQQEAIRSYLASNTGKLVGEYVEVESGKHDARPELAKALAHCRRTGSTLIVAKLDRLSRNSAFLMSVYAGTGDSGVVFCDLPTIPAGPVGKFIVQQMANVAELEAGLISARTKVALAAAKARGVQMGGFRGYKVDGALGLAARRARAAEFAEGLQHIVEPMRDQGASLRTIAAELESQGVATPSGGTTWTATTVSNVLKVMAAHTKG